METIEIEKDTKISIEINQKKTIETIEIEKDTKISIEINSIKFKLNYEKSEISLDDYLDLTYNEFINIFNIMKLLNINNLSFSTCKRKEFNDIQFDLLDIVYNINIISLYDVIIGEKFYDIHIELSD